jgi:CheY-like chemotaxis protein
VADTGIGIAAADLPLLFNKFTQVDSSLSKRHEGTGLGLAISRRLAQLMAGTLTVASELRKGTTFVLTLPLPLAAEPDPVSPGPQFLGTQIAAKGRRILLAEDNVVNQKIGVRLLEKCGCRVDLASDGREAVEMAGRFPYDLIFMDCRMPEMDGYAATRAIRAQQLDGSHIPIVALTAHAIAGTREECLAAGMDDYIAKPVSPAAMQQMVLKWSP